MNDQARRRAWPLWDRVIARLAQYGPGWDDALGEKNSADSICGKTDIRRKWRIIANGLLFLAALVLQQVYPFTGWVLTILTLFLFGAGPILPLGYTTGVLVVMAMFGLVSWEMPVVTLVISSPSLVALWFGNYLYRKKQEWVKSQTSYAKAYYDKELEEFKKNL